MLDYTDRHPEVIALRQNITELKRRETEELADLERGGAGTGAIRSLNANPLYQQVQSQLNQVQVEIASQQGAAAQHQREINNLQRFVNQAPEVEQEFSRLNRDYGSIKAQYDLLVERREQSRVSGEASRSGVVRFDTIEPPRASLDPVAPKRQLLFLASLFLAVGAGLAIALLPHLLSPTVDDVGTLERRFGFPVLGAVSVLKRDGEREYTRNEIRRVAIAGGALVLAAGVLVAVGGIGSRVLQQLFT